MSFVAYDLSFLAFFIVFLAVFLIVKRKNVKREGILILYRTKLGIKIIDYIGSRNKKFIAILDYFIIFIGYCLMAASIYTIAQFFYTFIKTPDLFQLVKIPPIAPLIPYLPQIFNADYLPPFYFTYWIVVLGITAIVHEFFHGIIAKAKGIKIKSTGFAFLGPFTGAFVEPDEKIMNKQSKSSQIAILSAGSFSNLLLTLIFFAVLLAFFFLAYAPSGVIFNTYAFSPINASHIIITNENLFIDYGGLNLTKVLVDNKTYYVNNASNIVANSYILAYEDTPALKAGLAGVIVEFNGIKIKDYLDLNKSLNSQEPGDNIVIKTLLNNSIKEYDITLGKRQDNNKAYLGIATINNNAGGSIFSRIRNKILFFKDPNTYYVPRIDGELIIFIYNLIWWIVIVNLGVALFNMLPLGITDGGKVFYLSILALVKSEKMAKFVYRFATYLILAFFLLITILWLFSFR